MLLLAVDVGWLEKDEMAEFLEGVRAPLGLPEDRLLIAFSHTHAGANLSSSMRDHPGGDKIRPYFEQLIGRCAEAGAEAIANLVPAWLTFGSGTCDLAQNRDAWDEDSQQFVTGFNPDGEADDTVLVARVSADDGSVAGHAGQLRLPPHYPGPDQPPALPRLHRRDARSDGGRLRRPCLFLLSPCGDTGPREGFVADTRIADSNGRRLGFAAAAVVESLLPAGRSSNTTAPSSPAPHSAPGSEPGSIRPRTTRHSRCAAALCASTCRSSLTTHRTPSRPPTTRPPATWKPRKPPATPSPSATPPPSASAPAAASSAARPSPTAAPSPSTSTSGGSATPFSCPCPPSPTPSSRPSCDPASPARPIFISVVTNGTLAYLLPRERYGKDLYQDWVSFPGPGGLELVMQTAAAAIVAMADEE